jgi:hypothetical protein
MGRIGLDIAPTTTGRSPISRNGARKSEKELTEQLRQLTVVPPREDDGRGNPAISTTASHRRAAERGG